MAVHADVAHDDGGVKPDGPWTQCSRLMGLSEAAFRTRLNRGQISGVVRTGRRIQVHRERLLAGLPKTKPGRHP